MKSMPTRGKLLAVLFFLPIAVLESRQVAAQQLTAQQAIDRIIQATGATPPPKTVDTIKGGDPEEKVTGIVTTFLDTYAVLQKAAADGHNLIITHEPTFFTHTDDTSILGDNPVQAQKAAFIRDHHLVVWRFHDLWHMRNPDGILEGVVATLGWQRYQDAKDPNLFRMPPTTLGALQADLKARLKATIPFRLVGDPKMRVTKVALLPGAAGEVDQVKFLERSDVELLIAGESAEWEAVEYTRDAIAQGRNKALLLLGHEVSEEPGMEYCAKWLQGIFPGMPIEFIKAGTPFAAPNPLH